MNHVAQDDNVRFRHCEWLLYGTADVLGADEDAVLHTLKPLPVPAAAL